MSSDLPTQVLEERAAEQRRRLHNTVAEMRATMREKINVRRNLNHYSRRYFPRAAAAVGTLGLVIGWTLGGIFDRK